MPGADSVRVVIWCEPDQARAAAKIAGALGDVELVTRRGLVQAVVPITSLTALAQAESIRFIELARSSQLEEESEGVELINAHIWSNADFSGTDVKVGILDHGFSGYTALCETDLPPCNDIKKKWAASIGDEGDEEHGTACAEIVYDIAPDAEFYLANYDTDAEFEDAVEWFIAQDVNVISHSCTWPAKGPGDGTGFYCGLVEDARGEGILWAQAVGNYGDGHWKGLYYDGNQDGIHEFDQGPVDQDNSIEVAAGDVIVAAINWSDPWGNSSNNYDLKLYDDENELVAWSNDVQQGQDCNPYEFLTYTAPAEGWYHIRIWKGGTADIKMLHLYSAPVSIEHQVVPGSVAVPADSTYAVAVGAVDEDDWDDPQVEVEVYSSRGPTSGSVIKPDLVAPDCVETDTYDPFCGTSAATPHAAGAAVLVKECYPSYDADDIQSFLENSAVDEGDAGKDNSFGSGKLELPTDKVEVELVDGYTIVALAVQPPVAYTASTLAAHINSQGADISEVFRWDTQGGDWDFWLVDIEYGTNFDIILGEGYLLNNGDASTWTYWGAELPGPDGEVDLFTDYNLIALPVVPTASYTASTMAAEINNQDGDVTEVFWWNPVGGTWDFWLVDIEYGTDFDIEIGEGYLLNCDDDSTWTIR